MTNFMRMVCRQNAFQNNPSFVPLANCIHYIAFAPSRPKRVAFVTTRGYLCQMLYLPSTLSCCMGTSKSCQTQFKCLATQLFSFPVQYGWSSSLPPTNTWNKFNSSTDGREGCSCKLRSPQLPMSQKMLGLAQSLWPNYTSPDGKRIFLVYLATNIEKSSATCRKTAKIIGQRHKK